MVDSYPERNPVATGVPVLPGAQWVVTFSPGHVLRSGRIQQADPALGGISLGNFCVVILADTAMQANAKVIELFGPGGWDEVYPADIGNAVARRRKLQPLLSLAAHTAIGELTVCGCRDPQYPHGRAWHADREG